MKDLIRNNDGFSLIEAVIALSILAIGILTVGVMQTTSINGNASASHMTVANTSSIDLFERLLDEDYDSALFTAGAHDDTEVAGLVLPAGVTSVTWTVKEGTSTDGVDDDGDGDIDEGDEVGIKVIVMTINSNDRGTVKIRNITFFKHEML